MERINEYKIDTTPGLHRNLLYRMHHVDECYRRSLTYIKLITNYPGGGLSSISEKYLEDQTHSFQHYMLIGRYDICKTLITTYFNSYFPYCMDELIKVGKELEPYPYYIYTCRNMKARIDRIVQRNCLRAHKKYFKEHIEEGIIATVCHPRNFHQFEALGFYDS